MKMIIASALMINITLLLVILYIAMLLILFCDGALHMRRLNESLMTTTLENVVVIFHGRIQVI